MEFSRKEFGARLKAAREEKGLTQARLGELVGMRQSRVSAYESGKYLMSLDLLSEYMVRAGLNPETVFANWLPRAEPMIARVETLA
jgi:transcriptional regulator with XRE-family HTH domain